MNRPLLTHLSWGAVALATFAAGLGYSRFQESGNPSAGARLKVMTDGTAMAANSSPLGAGNGKDATATVAVGAAKRPLTEAQIEALAKDAFNDPNPLTRNLSFAKLLESMTPENVSAVMQTLRDNRAEGDQWRLFHYAWGAMDGAGALAHAESLEGRDKSRFLNNIIPGWASKNPDAAMAWLEKQPDGEETTRFRGALVGGLADHDIGVATDYVLARAKAGDKEAMGYLETVAGEELRKNGAVAATRWGEALPDGALKGAALDRIAGEYVNEDPRAASVWAAKFANTDYGVRVVEEIGDEWAERDPKAAVAWLETLKEGAARSEASSSAFREWTQRDPLAASEYLTKLPASESKDAAVSGFVGRLAWEDPESAIVWADTISNERSRIQTLTQAGQAWYRRDPAAAANWLQGANLPADAMKRITEPPRDRRGGGRG